MNYLKFKNVMLILAFFLSSSMVQAGSENTGFGAQFGSVTGFNFNHFLNSKNSVEGAVAFSFGGDDNDYSLHSSYLWHKPQSLKLLGQVLDWYYSAGGKS